MAIRAETQETQVVFLTVVISILKPMASEKESELNGKVADLSNHKGWLYNGSLHITGSLEMKRVTNLQKKEERTTNQYLPSVSTRGNQLLKNQTENYVYKDDYHSASLSKETTADLKSIC